jgi:hypothetical protein
MVMALPSEGTVTVVDEELMAPVAGEVMAEVVDMVVGGWVGENKIGSWLYYQVRWMCTSTRWLLLFIYHVYKQGCYNPN